MILIGDTNCDFKNNTNANTKGLNWICFYSEYQLEKIINSYTRVAVTTNERNTTNEWIGKSLIDYFASSNPRFTLSTDIIETGMVDHNLIYGVRKNALRQKMGKPKPTESWNMKKYDTESELSRW